MIYSVQQIKFEIMAHVKEFGGDFGEWFVGITDDPAMALHTHHQVDPDVDIWLYKEALTTTACATVVRYFVERLNVQGDARTQWTDAYRFVYAYKKSERTEP